MFFPHNNKTGFTLVEVIVVMAIFIAVLMITASAFNTILTKTNIVARSEESNIEGVVGLEMLRHDLEQTGFGLFTDVDSEVGAITYAEAADAPASNYNDASSIPRALVADDELAITGLAGFTADYLVIKSTTVGGTTTSQKWTYVTDSGIPKVWGKQDFTDDNDKLLVVKQEIRKSDKALVRSIKQKNDSNYADRKSVV